MHWNTGHYVKGHVRKRRSPLSSISEVKKPLSKCHVLHTGSPQSTLVTEEAIVVIKADTICMKLFSLLQQGANFLSWLTPLGPGVDECVVSGMSDVSGLQCCGGTRGASETLPGFVYLKCLRNSAQMYSLLIYGVVFLETSQDNSRTFYV